MNLSFSTRGWNDLPWEDQVRDAEENRFQGIEVYNLTRFPALTDRGGPFHPYRQNETLRGLKEHGLVISNLDTSIDLSQEDVDPAEFAFLFSSAAALRAPSVSVCALTDDEDQVCRNIDALLKPAADAGISLLIKTTGIYANTARLRDRIPPECLYVAESGVKGPEDIAALRSIGADAALVGETLMRSEDKRAMLAAFREAAG